MRYLIEYANREEVTRVIDQALEHTIVHGVVVQLDPTWRTLWRLSHSLTPRDWRAMDKSLSYRIEWDERMLGSPLQTSALWWMQPPWGQGLATIAGQEIPVRVDPVWTCSSWDAMVRHDPLGRRGPFIINVLIVPRSPRPAFEELASALSESSERIHFEARSMARMLVKRKGAVRPLEGGISLGTAAGDYATLGGILDANGTRYALTCGHAINKNDEVRQPSPKDDSTATKIGVCIESTAGTLQGPVTRCNQKTAVNEMDAALIEVETNPHVNSKLEILGIGSLAGWAPMDDIDEDAPIEVVGRSGHRCLYTGGLFRIGSVRIGADRYCFRNLMEVKRASPQYWGFTGIVAPPAHPGDSGAWVVRDGPHGPEWCGMIIGGSGPVAYAVFAEDVLNWLQRMKYTSMSVV